MIWFSLHPTTSRELNKSFMSYMAIASFNASIRRFSKIVNIYFTYLHKNILREEGGDWLKI